MALVALFAGMMMGCEKEGTENKTDKSAMFNDGVNPYDVFGQYHNEAMQIVYDSAIVGKIVEVSPFACEFTANKFSLNSQYDYDFWIERFALCASYISDQFIPFYNENLNLDLSDNVFKPLTDYQRTYLNRIFSCIDSLCDDDEYFCTLRSIEKDVMSNEVIQDWEKGLVLGTISIAKYSYDFMIKHFSESKAPRWLERVKTVVKADAVGFVGGAIGSVVDGHAAAATMTFGPQGTVAVVAGEATVGAIVTSGTEIIHQVVTH